MSCWNAKQEGILSHARTLTGFVEKVIVWLRNEKDFNTEKRGGWSPHPLQRCSCTLGMGWVSRSKDKVAPSDELKDESGEEGLADFERPSMLGQIAKEVTKNSYPFMYPSLPLLLKIDFFRAF